MTGVTACNQCTMPSLVDASGTRERLPLAAEPQWNIKSAAPYEYEAASSCCCVIRSPELCRCKERGSAKGGEPLLDQNNTTRQQR